MKKVFSLIIVIGLVLISCLGCNQKKTVKWVEVKPASNPHEGIKIGMVVSTLLNSFFVEVKDGAISYADKSKIELIVLDSRNDAQTERDHIASLIEKEVDAIVLNTTDPNASIGMIEKAVKKDIKIITLDRRVNSDLVSVHVASDNYTGGKLAGHFMLEQLGGKGKVVELLGLEGVSVDDERGAGFHSVIENSEIEILAKTRADFDREKSEGIMYDLLNQYSEIDAVFAHNDEMALGALKAVTKAKRNIIIVGFDGIDDSIIAVQDGSLGASIAQQPRAIGVEGIRTSLKVLSGSDLQGPVLVPLKLITSFKEK